MKIVWEFNSHVHDYSMTKLEDSVVASEQQINGRPSLYFPELLSVVLSAEPMVRNTIYYFVLQT